MKAALLLALVVLTPTIVSGQKVVVPVRLYVTAEEPEAAAFVEPETVELRDSAKDIRNVLMQDPALDIELIDRRERADIVLTVVSRVRRLGDGTTTMVFPNGFGGFTASSIRPRRSYVLVRLSAGDYSREIVGESGTWSGAAGSVLNQVKKWVKLNGREVVARRQK